MFDISFLDAIFITTMVIFLWIVLGTTDFKNNNITSALGNLTMGIMLLKLQETGYLPVPGPKTENVQPY